MRTFGLSVLLVAMVLLPSRAAEASPAFPGAKRRADPTGRWYVTVESRSDRCALVARAPDSEPLEPIHDAGHGRYGAPDPINPIRPGDRVVVRSRIGGYPKDFLPASDGSGFAAITVDYGPPGYPSGDLVDLLHWVPRSGPRLVYRLPRPAPVPSGMISYGTPWQVERVAHESGLVVVSNWQGKPWNVVRLADGAVQSLPPGDAAAAEGAFQEQPRAQTVVTERSGPLAPSRIAVVLAAIRGDQAVGLTPYERVPIVTRAFELLGEDGGPALLRFFEGPQRNVADPERNVTRAAYWTLRSRDDGVELARAALADATRPVEVRIMCAWLVSQTVPVSELQPLRKAISDPDTRLSEAATWALADRRWEAGPEFLRLLRSGTGPQLVVAQFFETYIIEGSIPPLRAALARAPEDSPLRESLSKALRTQGAGGEGR